MLGEYEEKDACMKSCSICLVDLNPLDYIIAFTCNEKHYFHKKCGTDWLMIKAECPLCRKEFDGEILVKARNNSADADIFYDVARQHCVDHLRHDQRRDEFEEFIRELTDSINEFH